MNKRQKPSKSRRGAGITLAVCFVAAAVMVGTYTIQSSRELQRRQQAQEEEAKEKEQAGQEEAGSSLVINTREDPAGKPGTDRPGMARPLIPRMRKAPRPRMRAVHPRGGRRDRCRKRGADRRERGPDGRERRGFAVRAGQHPALAGGRQCAHELQHGQDRLFLHSGPV